MGFNDLSKGYTGSHPMTAYHMGISSTFTVTLNSKWKKMKRWVILKKIDVNYKKFEGCKSSFKKIQINISLQGLDLCMFKSVFPALLSLLFFSLSYEKHTRGGL